MLSIRTEETMFLRFALLLFCVNASATSIFNPKLIGKFNYLGGKHFEKHAGALAFENEFFPFLSAGIQVGAGKGKMRMLGDDEARFKSADPNVMFIDVGLYVKPQIAIDLGAVILTPYISFFVGVPSFSSITPKRDDYVFTQNYSTMVGLEMTLVKHIIVLGEFGFSAVSRMVKESEWQFPYVVTAGLGYRF